MAAGVYQKYLNQTAEEIPTVIVSTASAFKFPASVLEAITGKKAAEFEAVEALEKLGAAAPSSIKELSGRAVIHSGVCAKEEMPRIVLEFAAK